jgi:hypothetical protein
MTKYDDLVNKHVMLEKELVSLKKTSKSRRCACKESITALKKEKDHNIMKLEAEKEKNILANLTIEEERSLGAQYKIQVDDEREARKAVESDMGEHLSKANSLRDQVSTI